MNFVLDFVSTDIDRILLIYVLYRRFMFILLLCLGGVSEVPTNYKTGNVLHMQPDFKQWKRFENNMNELNLL